MGALDWLQEIIGGGNSMPPMQGAGMDAPPLPRPEMTDIAGGMQGAGRPPPYPEGTDPMTAGLKPPLPPTMATQPMPPVQGMDLPPPAPYPQGGDPMQASPPPYPQGGDPVNGSGNGNGPGLPPNMPFPPGGDPMAGTGSGNGPGLPRNMPVPPAQNMNFSSAPLTRPAPQNITPPIPPSDVSAAARTMPPAPDSGPQAQGIIGRALGLDPNREAQLRGSLGAGLKAAGENSNKGKGAAFAGSLGAGIEGGKAATDKTTDQQDRYLGRKLAANTQDLAKTKAGSEATLNLARTQLALAQAKQAMAGGKESVVNSEQQLYLRAQSAAAQDGRLKALKTAADRTSAEFGSDSPQAKAAIKAHKEAYDETLAGHATALGLDPKKAASIGKQPGMSQDNPVPKAGLDQKKFDALPPGSYFVNPKDGRVLIKKGPAPGAAGGNQPAPAQQQMTPSVPPTPPVPVTAPAGSRADQEEED